MKTVKNKLQMFVIPFLLIFLMIQFPVFANTITEEPTSKVETNKTEETVEKNKESKSEKKNQLTTSDFAMDNYAESVTLDELTNKLEKKGFQVVESMQTVVAPILIILLIVSFLVSAIGFVGKARNVIGYGIAAMLLIGFAYIGIMYAPEILDFFKNFMLE